MAQDKSRTPVQVEPQHPKINLDELTVDVSAFLHFLSEHYDGEQHSEMPSFWMLIPKSLDVEWREGTKEIFLEKEVFSRKIYVVAPPVLESDEQKRRVELLLLFQSAVAEDQTRQILLLVSRLKEESRKAMIEKFQQFKAAHEPSPRRR